MLSGLDYRANMAQNWYALHSHPRKEDSLWQQVQSQGYEVFYPRIRVQTVNPRARKVKPYFPGYLFIRADLQETGLSVFQWMPYSTGLVSFGGEPAVVPDALIHAISRRIEEIAQAGGELFDAVKPGDQVRVQTGPFAGYEGIFDTRVDGTQRVRILLRMLSKRDLPIEMEAGQIEPVDKSKRKK
jgi:transcription antitermination factor NusG